MEQKYDDESCQTCKKYYMQGGKCCENRKNCLFYEREPRGRIIRDTFVFHYSQYAETELIKTGEIIHFEDDKRHFDAEIIKINYINMKTGYISVEAAYHENERPRLKKRKLFKRVK